MSLETENEKLRQTLKDAQEKLIEQDQYLQMVSKKPRGFGTIVQITKDSILVSQGGDVMQMERTIKDCKVGDVVVMSPMTGQPLEVYERPLLSGQVVVVHRVHKEYVEIETGGGVRAVQRGNIKVEAGDRVVLDQGQHVVLQNLGRDETGFQLEEIPKVNWEEIGGLSEAKREMREAVEMPWLYKDIYKFYGKQPLKGVLLWGPPGCGKTMLGKAAATATAKMHGAEGKQTGFIYVKGPELLSQYVGLAEMAIRGLFARAREHYKKYQYPAVMFIDEADAILGARGSGISSDVERTTVPQFLSEMDGLVDNHCLVILATNRPDTLDSAVTRDGRIDRKVRVTRPGLPDAIGIFKIYLKRVPQKQQKACLATVAASELFSQKNELYQVQMNHGSNKIVPFTLGSLVNGAMIAGVVDQATSIAMHRDIRNKEKTGKGVEEQDIQEAVRRVYVQNQGLNHQEELRDFVNDLGGPEAISGIRKVTVKV